MTLLPLALLASPPALALGGVAVTIQCDPQISATDHWADLVAVVQEANSYGHRLTILLAPDWARHILASPQRRMVAARWVNDNGHQFGFHHHDVTHQNPDDTCAVPEADWDETWLSAAWADACQPYWDSSLDTAPVTGLESILKGPPFNIGSGDHVDFNVANHGNEQDMRSPEWQGQYTFSQGRQGNGSNNASISGAGSLWGTSCQSYSGVDVPELGTIWFNPLVSAGAVDFNDVLSDLKNGATASSDYIAVTFHPEEYTGSVETDIDRLFMATYHLHGTTELVSEILVREAPCGP